MKGGRSRFGIHPRLRARVWALLCAVVLGPLAACAPRTDLPVPDTRLPLAFEAKPRAPTVAPAESAIDRWWLGFNDAQLTALIDQTLAASPDAKSALARLREARANRTEALFPFYPQGNPGASATQQYTDYSVSGLGTSGSSLLTPSGGSQQYGAAWNVTWELDLFGEIRVARRAADADLNAVAFDYEATRIALAAQTASLLFQARGSAVQLADARENADIARRLADTAALKVKAGLAASNETARLDADAATAEAEVARLMAVLENQRRQLLALIGQGAAPSTSLPITAEIAVAPAVPEMAPGELLVRRPDVRRAERQLASASARVQLDKLALFPRLQLRPGAQIAKSDNSGYGTVTSLWSIGLGLTLPVLDRPRLLAEIKAQTARGEQAAFAYERAVQNAYSDAEQALASIAADQKRIESLTAATARARFAFDAITTGYRAGLIDITTLIQAQQAWRAARTQLRAVQTGALLNAVNAFKAFGGGWDPAAPLPIKTAQR